MLRDAEMSMLIKVAAGRCSGSWGEEGQNSSRALFLYFVISEAPSIWAK